MTVENPVATKENAKNPKRSLWSAFTRQAPRRMKVTTNVYGGMSPMSPTYANSQDPPMFSSSSSSSSSSSAVSQLFGFSLSSGTAPEAGSGAGSGSSGNAGWNGSGGDAGGSGSNSSENETLELGGLSEQSTVGELRNRLGCELYKTSRMNYGETFGLPPSLTRMHLFWKGYELRGEAKTLKQLRITPGSSILAKFAMVPQKSSVAQLCLGTEDFLLYKYYRAAGEAAELEGGRVLGPRFTLAIKRRAHQRHKDQERKGSPEEKEEEEEFKEDEEEIREEEDEIEEEEEEEEEEDAELDKDEDDDPEDSAESPSHIFASSAMFNKVTHMYTRGELRFPEKSKELRELCLELLNLVPHVSQDIAEELFAQPLDTSFTQEGDRYMYLYKLLLIDTYINTEKKKKKKKNKGGGGPNANSGPGPKAEFLRVCEKFERGGGVDMLADVILPCAISKHEAEVELGNAPTIYKLIIVHTISILHYFIVERSGRGVGLASNTNINMNTNTNTNMNKIGNGNGNGNNTNNNPGIFTIPFMEQCFCVLKIISPDPARDEQGLFAGAGRAGEAVECASVLCTIDIICECIHENPDESLNVLFSSTGIRSSLIYTVPAILNKYSPLLRNRVAQGLLAVFEKILEALERLNYTFENDSLLDFFLHVVDEAEKSKSASESFFALFDALVRSRLFPASACLAFFAEKLLHYASPELTLTSPPDAFLGGILTLIASSIPAQPPQSSPGARAKAKEKGGDGAKRLAATAASEAAAVGLGKALVEELYDNCLMRALCDTAAFPKCKAPESRARAYAALRAVLRISPALAQQLTAALIRHVEALDLKAGWNYPSPAEEDALEGCAGSSSSGSGSGGLGGVDCAVGLKNLGATCYMNAILQQLYMTAEFRDFVLSIEDCPHAPANGADFDTLFQLQNLFSAMQLQIQQRAHKLSLRKRAVDTSPFCHTLRVLYKHIYK